MTSLFDPSILSGVLGEGIPLPPVSAAYNSHTRIANAMTHALFLGMILPAVFKYYCRFPDDRWMMKFYVAVIAITATLQTILFGYGLWLGIQHPLLSLQRSGIFGDIAHEFLIVLVQPYFIVRAYKLTRGKVMLAFLLLLFTASQVTFIMSGVLPGFREVNGKIRDLLLPSMAITVCTDVAITIFLLMYFRGARSGVAPDTMANKLIYYTWVSAAPPAISLLIAFALAFHLRTFPYAVVFLLLSGKLYSLAFLITQNSRATLRGVSDSYGRGLGRISLHEEDLRQLGIIGPPKLSYPNSPEPPLVEVRCNSEVARRSLNRGSVRSSQRHSQTADESTLAMKDPIDIELDELSAIPQTHWDNPDSVSPASGDRLDSSQGVDHDDSGGAAEGSRVLTKMQTLIEALKEDSPVTVCGKCGGATAAQPAFISNRLSRQPSCRSVDLEIGDDKGGYSHYSAHS